MSVLRRIASVLLLGTAALPAAAQTATLDQAARRAVVDSLARSLVDGYVFPAVAEKMAVDLRSRLARGEYHELGSDAFATRLTRDLNEIAHDGHHQLRL